MFLGLSSTSKTDYRAPMEQSSSRVIAPSLFLFAILYGGMVPLGGFLGAKQVQLAPFAIDLWVLTISFPWHLAVEAGIFPFLTLIAISSAIAELHGRVVADRLVRFGFIPLVVAIVLTVFVLQLPTDRDMYEPAKEAFPIIVGQGWRMMAAGILAYGVSVSLNVWIFSRMTANNGRLLPIRGFVAAALSQIVDTLIFITISFYGVRPIADLMLGQMIAKVVLSAVMVPLLVMAVVAIGRKMDAKAELQAG